MPKCYFKDSYSGVCNLITGKNNCYGCKWFKTKEQFYNDMDRAALMLFKKGLVKHQYKNADGNVHVKAIPITKMDGGVHNGCNKQDDFEQNSKGEQVY